MTVAHATALLPSAARVVLRDHHPAEDAAALEALARWAIRFAPNVAADPPDGLLLDVTGCQRLYGGDAKLAALVVDSIRRLGFEVRAAVAPTVGGAWGLARFATSERQAWRVVGDGALPEALMRLPVGALRVENRVVDELAEVGIDRIGQLLEAGREEIAGRFGPEVLLRVDQAFGEAMEVIEPMRPEPPLLVSRRFAGPTTQYEAIEQAVQGLVEHLWRALLKREAGVRRLVLEVERLNRDLRPERAQESITLSRPSRDAEHLWAILRPRVERLHLGEGVERIELIARRTSLLSHEQEQFAGESHDLNLAAIGEAAGQLIDLLQSRLGTRAVVRCQPHDTHIPEAAFRFHPASEGGLAPGPPTTGEMEGDRPTVLLERPEPVRVTLLQPEGPVIGVQWRSLHRIVSAVGPERIGRRWWHFGLSSRQPARDYYKLQDEQGQWLWVYRNRATGRWFVHGLWA